MYLSYYNLKEKPFQIRTDPKFIWFGANHQEALAVLEYGVIDNKGFLLITGDVGTGKTTLINALLTRLDNDVVVANITNPILEELDFFNIVAGLKENIFNDNSIREISSFSNGYPRLINIICDHALLTGYVKGVKTINEEIIKECAYGLFLTRENNDYDRNDLNTSHEEISVIEKKPTITPSEYTNRSNLPEEKVDYLHDRLKPWNQRRLPFFSMLFMQR